MDCACYHNSLNPFSSWAIDFTGNLNETRYWPSLWPRRSAWAKWTVCFLCVYCIEMRISAFEKCSEWHTAFSLMSLRYVSNNVMHDLLCVSLAVVLFYPEQGLYCTWCTMSSTCSIGVYTLRWDIKPCTGFYSKAQSREKTIFARNIYVEDEGQAAAVMMYGIISHQLQSKQAKSARQFTTARSIRCCYKMCTICHNANTGWHPRCPSLLLLLTIALSTFLKFIFLEAQESFPISVSL